MGAPLRQLTTLAIVLSAALWATPCVVWQGGLELAVPEAVHAGHNEPSAQADPHAHHGHPAPAPSEEPAAEWQAACPCGCDQPAQPGQPAGRIGYALAPAVPAPLDIAGAPISIGTQASLPTPDGPSIEHVPIPS